MRIDAVHYCYREADLAAKRKRRSFIGRNGENPPCERLNLFCRSVRGNQYLAYHVQYLKIPYMTRELCQAEIARTVSAPLPNLRYIDLPQGLYSDDPSSNTLKQELQARCEDIRQMKYAGGAEESFQRLAQTKQWPNLESLDITQMAAIDPVNLADVVASLKSLRHIRFTSLPSLDDSMFNSMRRSPFPPLAVLEFRNILSLSANGLLAYLSYPEAKQALKSLTLASTGVLPSDLFQILALAPSLDQLHVAESVSRAFPSQPPFLASCSLRNLHYEITSANSSPRGLSSPSDSYYSYLSSSILRGSLPSLTHLYALSTSLPTMLLPPPQPNFAMNGASNTNQPVNNVMSRPLRLYTKAVTEMEWNLTVINPGTPADRRGSATTTRPMSLYVENQLGPRWREKGRESVMVGNGFGGFLAVPSEDTWSGSPKGKKGKQDVDAWMG